MKNITGLIGETDYLAGKFNLPRVIVGKIRGPYFPEFMGDGRIPQYFAYAGTDHVEFQRHPGVHRGGNISQPGEYRFNARVQGEFPAPAGQAVPGNRFDLPAGGFLDHLVEIGGHRVPFLRCGIGFRQRLYFFFPEAGHIDPAPVQVTRGAVRRQGIVKIKNDGNDLVHWK